jgi:exodeoxyribonuclease V beta subunit
MTEPTRFDVCGPLPAGVTILEASAGTGKTWTIASLAARYVAEGVPLSRLLAITFTRMATGELRERVRDRLITVEAAVRSGRVGDDEVVALLARGPHDDVTRRCDRLARAIADFDAATITTTHGFCLDAIGSLGIGGDRDPDAAFVEEVDDMIDEVIDDLYVRRFRVGGPAAMTRAHAADIARLAINNPGAPIAEAPSGELPEMRRRLAEAARTELEARKRASSVLTFDDLLTRLHGALDGMQGDVAAARLSERFDVVLVDEFQDTDPVQWAILRRAFAQTGRTLVLIADPKQAIYAFRGADVYAYLAAAAEAGAQHTLDVNHRSDQGLIDAYDAVFARTQLGHPGIVYRQVRATREHQAPRLTGAPADAPLRIRFVPRDAPGIALTRTGCATVASARDHVVEDLAADIVRLLDSGALVDGERVQPGHIGVLVRTNRGAADVRDALEAAGVPAVINGAGSVFETEPAASWLRLLEALEQPSSSMRARSAALTDFFGWSAERVAQADEQDWGRVHVRLHDWARVLRTRGVAALLAEATLTEAIAMRLLRHEDGERRLTDLRHIGQLLHAEATGEQLGATALTSWLRRRIDEAASDTANEERSRRLESDADAVQVLTIHRSKGLEFPIVYAPFLWDPPRPPRQREPLSFFDEEAGERRLDVSLEGVGYAQHELQARAERRGEELRLAYVALTRARHQAVIWWAGTYQARSSPLSRLVLRREAGGEVAYEVATPADDMALAAFAELAERAPGRIAVERSTLDAPASWSPPLEGLVELDVARLGRGFDWEWRRTSYSDLAAGSHDAAVGSEPEEGDDLAGDEPADPLPAAAPAAPQGSVLPSLLADLPAGRDVGTFVHRVLERLDFAAADLDGELAEQIGEGIGEPEALAAGLRAAIETPLGPLVGGARLRDVARADRLDELAFELPLGGGEAPRTWLTIATIAGLLREHLGAGDPMVGYADRLEAAGMRRRVRGYLAGFLDVVIRLPGPRFAVVDYKTNWLAPPGEALTTWHHRAGALTAEMHARHYGLQALLYSVALHRYLRWRLQGYDPAEHLAGVLYLFVRGMVGPESPVVDGQPSGVFAWRPPAPLVAALSDAFDRERPV